MNHELNYSSSPGSEVVPEIPVFASLVLGLQAAPTPGWLAHGSGEPRSDPHSFSMTALPVQPSPSPHFLILDNSYSG